MNFFILCNKKIFKIYLVKIYLFMLLFELYSNLQFIAWKKWYHWDVFI